MRKPSSDLFGASLTSRSSIAACNKLCLQVVGRRHPFLDHDRLMESCHAAYCNSGLVGWAIHLFSFGTAWPEPCPGPPAGGLAALCAGFTPAFCPKAPKRCSSFFSRLTDCSAALLVFGLSTPDSLLLTLAQRLLGRHSECIGGCVLRKLLTYVCSDNPRQWLLGRHCALPGLCLTNCCLHQYMGVHT